MLCQPYFRFYRVTGWGFGVPAINLNSRGSNIPTRDLSAPYVSARNENFEPTSDI